MISWKTTAAIILINKPAGLTSFQCLSPLKKALGHGKIGHCGTLDKFASGLLIVCNGPATKLVPLITNENKTYRAEFCFGKTSETLDPESQIIESGIIPTENQLLDALDKFRGEIDQVPPKYSAIHVQGKRAYELSLAGKDPVLPPRKVNIYVARMLEYKGERALFEFVVSKGTYIRSIARDLSAALGTNAYVSSLERTMIGNFSLENAINLNGFQPELHCIRSRKMVDLLPDFAQKTVSDYSVISRIRNGILPESSFFSDWDNESSNIALLSNEGDLLAVCKRDRKQNNKIRFSFVVAHGA